MYDDNKEEVMIAIPNLLEENPQELEDWCDKKIEELVLKNKDKDVISDIVYILSNDERLKILLEKYTALEIIRGKNQFEAFVGFWNFVYDTIPKYFFKGMSELAFKNARKLVLIDINRTKKSWSNISIKSLKLKENKFLKRELEECKQVYIRDSNSLQKLFGIHIPDQIIEYRKNWFNQWLDYNNLMVEFPYLTDLTEFKIKNAFRLDIINCVTSIIMNEYNSNLDTIKSKRPEELMIGIFALTPRIKGEILADNDNGKLLFKQNFEFTNNWSSDNSPNDGNISILNATLSFDPKRLIVSNEQLTNNEFISSIINNTTSPDVYEKIKNNPTTLRRLYTNLTLDVNDKKMISYITNKSKAQRVRIYFSEIFKVLGITDGSDNYKIIESRLLKLPGYYYIGSLSNGSLVSFNFFSSVNVDNDDSGRFADVTLSENIYHSITKGRIYQIYRRELNMLNNSLAVDLAYIFEMERTNLINMKYDLYNTSYSYNIDFFRQYVYLSRKKTLKKNMEFLEMAIIELCERKLIIKSYEIGVDFFKITYYPDTENSKNIINSTFSLLKDNLKE